MPSSGISAFGTLLKKGDGATPEVFTTIAEVVNIAGPKLTLDPIDITNHSSTGGWEESVGGILHGGDATFSINYLPTNATHNATTGLIYDMINRVKRNFQLVFPNVGATTWAFTGLVTAFSPAEPHDGKLSADVSVHITGVPTLV